MYHNKKSRNKKITWRSGYKADSGSAGGVGPKILHFQQVLRWCRCCWSMDHTMSSKELEPMREERSPSPVTLLDGHERWSEWKAMRRVCWAGESGTEWAGSARLCGEGLPALSVLFPVLGVAHLDTAVCVCVLSAPAGRQLPSLRCFLTVSFRKPTLVRKLRKRVLRKG